jgi:methylase of polypeptide subunit release factors
VGGADPEKELARRRSRPERQQLGQFFTPEPLAQYLAELLAKSKPETVLDPAVGGGRLLRALPRGITRFGIDVDPLAIEMARASLPANVELAEGDFLNDAAWPLTEQSFDAIVANPPYIRHHRLRADQKARRLELNSRLGIRVSAFADYYVYFFCEAIRRLNPGGKLAFLTPAHFLEAPYGEPLKDLLLREGTIERVVVFDHNRGVFQEARTPAAVTLFTKQPSRRHTVFQEAEFNGRVQHLRDRRLTPNQLTASESWKQHLPSRETSVTTGGLRIGDILDIRRGLATGSNSFFTLSEEDRRAGGIPHSYVRPVLVSGRNLPERAFTPADWQARFERGDRVWLLWCFRPLNEISSKRVRAYIEGGRAAGVHLRTMCQRSKRLPWYAVENVDPPDFIFTYMSKKPLRFIENTAGVRALTALLGGWVRPDVDRAWARDILLSDATSRALTAAAKDLGEGLRKIEPRRLADVKVPFPARRLSAVSPYERSAVIPNSTSARSNRSSRRSGVS